MADAYIGEIRLYAGSFSPFGWFYCDGASYPCIDYQALFALIGFTYGGNNKDHFAVPDLRGRIPIGATSDCKAGTAVGAETIALTSAQMPTHTHALVCSSAANTDTPVNAFFGTAPSCAHYTSASSTEHGPMAADLFSSCGSGQAHDNMMPSLCVSYIICWSGVFPASA